MIEECLGAGLRAVQVREKDLAVRDLWRWRSLRDVTRRHGARLVINDRADVALAVGARTVSSARTPRYRWRRSAASSSRCFDRRIGSWRPRRDRRWPRARISWSSVPIYDTPSKRQYGKPQGLHALEHARDGGRIGPSSP